MTHHSSHLSNPGELFDSLQAEREESWLADVFVPPAEFSAFAGARSVVVFGQSGSGKTALRLMLSRYAESAPAQGLVVPWRPVPRPEASGTPAARALFAQALGACARELLRRAGRTPERWRGAPPWVSETGRWLIHTFTPEFQRAPAYHLSRMAEEATPEGAALQAELVTGPTEPLFDSDIAEEQLVGELVGISRRLGYHQLWLMVDGLERLAEHTPAELSGGLSALFSTLAIFEHPDVALKMVAPIEIEPTIRASGGITRRRIAAYDLIWSASELEQMLVRRMALALDRPEFDLSAIYSRGTLLRWMTDNAYTMPRQWLDLGRRLLERYQAQDADRPLSDATWRQLAHERPHSLRIDSTTGQVFVDDQEVPSISPASFKLLCYLYLNHSRLCTRSELYFLALRELSQEPRTPQDSGYEDPKEYNHVLDAQLFRLRQEIEPDPKQPVFLRVIRGRGVRLEHVRLR